MDAMKFGKFIANRRKDLKMTQSDLASKLFVTDKAVSKWERGLGFPDITTIEILANALDVSVVELMKSKIDEDKISIKEAESAITNVVEVAKLEMEERKKIIFHTSVATVLVIIIFEILFNLVWNSHNYTLTTKIPYFAILPGIMMIVYSIICKIRGKNTNGVWVLGIVMFIIPVILIFLAVLICTLITG